jgi:hypothetical protein
MRPNIDELIARLESMAEQLPDEVNEARTRASKWRAR